MTMMSNMQPYTLLRCPWADALCVSLDHAERDGMIDGTIDRVWANPMDWHIDGLRFQVLPVGEVALDTSATWKSFSILRSLLLIVQVT